MKKQIAFLAIAFASIASAHANEETQVPPAQPSSTTRTEVTSDLVAWRNSGLAEVSRGENTPDIYATKYRNMYAAYQQRVQFANANNRTAVK